MQRVDSHSYISYEFYTSLGSHINYQLYYLKQHHNDISIQRSSYPRDSLVTRLLRAPTCSTHVRVCYCYCCVLSRAARATILLFRFDTPPLSTACSLYLSNYRACDINLLQSAWNQKQLLVGISGKCTCYAFEIILPRRITFVVSAYHDPLGIRWKVIHTKRSYYFNYSMEQHVSGKYVLYSGDCSFARKWGDYSYIHQEEPYIRVVIHLVRHTISRQVMYYKTIIRSGIGGRHSPHTPILE